MSTHYRSKPENVRTPSDLALEALPGSSSAGVVTLPFQPRASFQSSLWATEVGAPRTKPMKGKTARTSLAVNMAVSEASCRMEANEAEGLSELGEEDISARSFMRTTVAPRALFFTSYCGMSIKV